MRILACMKVLDAIVLGCDSATQITGKDPSGNIGVLKVYGHSFDFYCNILWKLL